MLSSYAFMRKEISISFYYEVWEEICKLKWYFYRFAGVNAEEAMQRTLMHTILHFQSDKGNLYAYIKKLAREITKDNNRLIPVDFLEQTLAEEDDSGETRATVDTGRVSDFSNELVDTLTADDSARDSIVNLALEFMDRFVILCEALRKRDTTTTYYPEIFIKQCLKISSKCENFNKLCLELYSQHKADFKRFCNYDIADADSVWCESDYMYVFNNTSKRYYMVNASTYNEVIDADSENWVMHGNIGTGDKKKKIIKVDYYSVWDFMCDLVDSEVTNEMKFILGNSYIIKTFGGSLSIINPDLYNIYDLIRVEIITNLLRDTFGKVLNVGSRNLYLLCTPDFEKTSFNCTVRGHNLNFTYIDITDTVH